MHADVLAEHLVSVQIVRTRKRVLNAVLWPLYARTHKSLGAGFQVPWTLHAHRQARASHEVVQSVGVCNAAILPALWSASAWGLETHECNQYHTIL